LGDIPPQIIPVVEQADVLDDDQTISSAHNEINANHHIFDENDFAEIAQMYANQANANEQIDEDNRIALLLQNAVDMDEPQTPYMPPNVIDLADLEQQVLQNEAAFDHIDPTELQKMEESYFSAQEVIDFNIPQEEGKLEEDVVGNNFNNLNNTGILDNLQRNNISDISAIQYQNQTLDNFLMPGRRTKKIIRPKHVSKQEPVVKFTPPGVEIAKSLREGDDVDGVTFRKTKPPVFNVVMDPVPVQLPPLQEVILEESYVSYDGAMQEPPSVNIQLPEIMDSQIFPPSNSGERYKRAIYDADRDYWDSRKVPDSQYWKFTEQGPVIIMGLPPVKGRRAMGSYDFEVAAYEAYVKRIAQIKAKAKEYGIDLTNFNSGYKSNLL
jgi:hypothetical protein